MLRRKAEMSSSDSDPRCVLFCKPLLRHGIQVHSECSFDPIAGIQSSIGNDFFPHNPPVPRHASEREPAMKLVIFGLTVSSSWGNGHATLWRGLCSALARQGHDVTFFERDVPYYANHRDLVWPEAYKLLLYSQWPEVSAEAEAHAREADVAIVTSYCHDAIPAADLVLNSNAIKVYYDLDTAVTLQQFRSKGKVDYLPPDGLSGFDLVLSYVGGSALQDLKNLLGARRVAPLYGSVDPDVHKPVAPAEDYTSDLSYLGTYAPDRQPILEELFLKPAKNLPDKKFILGGAQYPEDFPWNDNVWFVRHVAPPEHARFYSSSRATLNVTRAAMANTGYCPSGRLFEAAACETPVITDFWPGLDQFFEPGKEIAVASSSQDVVDFLSLGEDELRHIGQAARERVLSAHTAEHRSRELTQLLESVA
jgi:spore maturation protein CgeB